MNILENKYQSKTWRPYAQIELLPAAVVFAPLVILLIAAGTIT